MQTEEIGKKLLELWERESKFSQETFGPDSNKSLFIGCIRHLKLEVLELEEKPADFMEYADCFILLMESFRRAGGTLEQMLEVAEKKLNINIRRKWGKIEDGQPIEHVE